MKIFDCFPFFNELEILELRLTTLGSVVDYFVLVEANVTMTGKPKEFVFEKNRFRYRRYLDKIIYVKVKDAPKLSRKLDDWTIDYFQRNCITRGLRDAKIEDKIIISDADEIPNPTKIVEYKDSRDNIFFNQYLFNFFVNCFEGNWNGPIMTSFDESMPFPQELRARARGVNVKNGGWHYSYMGGLNRILKKLDSIVEGPQVLNHLGSVEDIKRKVNSFKSLFDEEIQYYLVYIYKDNLAPKTM